MGLKLLTLRVDDTCARCAAAIPARSRAWSDHGSTSVVCVICEPLRLDDPFPLPEIERASSGSQNGWEHQGGPDGQDHEVGERPGPGVVGRVMKLLADEPSTTTEHPNGTMRERRL